MGQTYIVSSFCVTCYERGNNLVWHYSVAQRIPRPQGAPWSDILHALALFVLFALVELGVMVKVLFRALYLYTLFVVCFGIGSDRGAHCTNPTLGVLSTV